jgi:SAM-dependent methyltransferase
VSEFVYIGSELELFAHATHWKAYFRSHLEPFIGQRVLEVGAGMGTTTKLLCCGTRERWVCLEPDDRLAKQLRCAIRSGEIPSYCEVIPCTLAQLPQQQQFDTIIYIDVLEHIEDDRCELAQATEALEGGGHLLVLSPAHPLLYSPFDRAIGHYRRYSRKTLAAVAHPSLQPVKLIYLDSVGLLISLANRLLLRQAMPNQQQIIIWDRYIVALSAFIDPLLRHRIGKSILAVWQKQPYNLDALTY